MLLEREEWTFEAEDLYPQAAWWLGRTEGSARGEYESRLFPETGLAVLKSASGRVIMDAGRFGPGRAGHSHSDSLSVIANAGERPILVDSGTYTYVGDPELRNAFRGSAAHSTIRIDGRDQAIALGPFWWGDPPGVRIASWHSREGQDDIIAECRYGGFVHRRLVRFIKPHLVCILDCVGGPAGEQGIEQFWHLASPQAASHLFFGSAAEQLDCWHSRVFGAKERARCLVVRRRTRLPANFAAALRLKANGEIRITEGTDFARFELPEAEALEIAWPKPD
jgi:hypothetical protein